MAPAFKLTYFDGQALAEVSIFLMKYGHIEFEDDRFQREQWPEIKQKILFGQVPLLTADGKQYHQSLAIARFLARKVKLAGSDEWEELEINSVVDTVNDLRLKIALYFYEQDAAIKESRKRPLLNETLPYYLTRLDKIAKDNNGHLACNKLTWADMYFVSLLDYFNYMLPCNSNNDDIIKDYSNLLVIKIEVLAIPAIKQWVAIRPKIHIKNDMIKVYNNLQTVKKNVLDIPVIQQYVATRPRTSLYM